MGHAEDPGHFAEACPIRAPHPVVWATVTNPRFRPRASCEPSTNFGTARLVTWESPDGMTESALDQLGTAKIQHVHAQQVRAALAADGATIASYAKDNGTDMTRLGRILRGDVIMRIEDMVNAERNLKLRERRAVAGAAPSQR